jgi:predicted DNA-binding ribbon-helix-helix protein
MKSLVSKRSIIVAAHKTSVSLEDAFWNALKEIAKARNVTVSDLVGTISVYRKELSDLKQGANREINCLGGMSLVEV